MSSRSGEPKEIVLPSSTLSAPGAEIGDALRIEKLLSEMLRALTRLTADEIDSQIEPWLQRIVIELDLDRSVLLQVPPGEGTFRTSHSWGRDGVPAVPNGLDGLRTIPFLAKRAINGEMVVVSSTSELPPEALEERQFSREYGTKSTVMIPLTVGNGVFGVVAFGSIRKEREWPPELLRRLKFVAEILASVLDRKRALNELRDLRREINHAARLSMMGELTASIAHELNQPLGAILSNAQAATRLLSADQPDIEEAKAALADIIRDDRRAVEIIGNVRALLQKGEPKMSRLDIGTLLHETEEILRKDAQTKQVQVTIETGRSTHLIVGDKTQLLQVLINLFLNAFDAVAEESQGPRHVSVKVFQHDRKVHVQIRDSGKGIDPAVMSRLFNAFITTKPRGMGIGLAIANSIVQEHGGRLWAAQNPDRGATLEFSLPAFPAGVDAGSQEGS